MSPTPNQVLVIGATGSIGQLVVARLTELGLEPIAFTRDADRGRQVLGSHTRLFEGDLSDAASLRAAVTDVQSVIMTHGAAYGSGDYEAVDYGAVPALLAALDARRPHVVLMSSIGVTGEGGPARDLLNWKRRGEMLLRASGLPYTIVRPGWFDAGSAADDHINLRQGDLVEYGPVRRVHVADTLVQAIRNPEAIGKTMEVFSSSGPRVTDWPAEFARLTPDEQGTIGEDGPEPERFRRELERVKAQRRTA